MRMLITPIHISWLSKKVVNVKLGKPMKHYFTGTFAKIHITTKNDNHII